ncbi:GNAT family N-acetyltransferase [Cohnella zeiphila]|uniref:GNAT family N-acetyltransferase n=1 Tax=Cohnella zeiphila TaxID=2761120 RepID=A0A7X0VW14_9BACL|nr:GNAT family N-acetyltransferase [Cohnella zeiphila]MBB6732486.1 GNAT family N-acetyltransferase [Cohnella zeiphila]
MRAEVIACLERLESLSESWAELVAEMDRPDLYDTWEWVISCLTRFHGKAAEPFVIAVFDGDRCVGIAPLHRVNERHGGMIVRTLQWITYGLAMYGGFCLHGGRNEAEVLGKMADALVACRDEWDLLKLANVNSSRNATFLVRKLLADRFSLYAEEADYVPYLNLVKDYPGKINGKERKDIERRERNLLRERRVRIELDRPFSADVWERALELHLAKWPDSLLHDPRYRGFCRQLYEDLSDRGQLGMSYLEIDGRIEAVNVCHFMNRKVYGKLTAYSPEYARYGLGLILLNRLLCHYRDKGMEEFDFEGGTQPFKFYWTDTVRKNFNYYVCNNNAKRTFLRLWCALVLKRSLAIRARKLAWRSRLRALRTRRVPIVSPKVARVPAKPLRDG